MTNATNLGFRIIDTGNGKARAKTYKRLDWARAAAEHLTACHGRAFVVARVVAA